METFLCVHVNTLFGKLSFFTEVPKVREIMYCTEGLGERKTNMIRHSMRYASGYAETPIGGDGRHFGHFWTSTNRPLFLGRLLRKSQPRQSSDQISQTQWGKLLQIHEQWSRCYIQILLSGVMIRQRPVMGSRIENIKERTNRSIKPKKLYGKSGSA